VIVLKTAYFSTPELPSALCVSPIFVENIFVENIFVENINP
jgi:hypothetical protein